MLPRCGGVLAWWPDLLSRFISGDGTPLKLIAVMVFLGGWWAPIPFLDFLPPALTFVIKGVLMVFLNMWVRWTLPRVRVDQLMHLCWKVMIPVTLICVIGSGIWMMVSGQAG